MTVVMSDPVLAALSSFFQSRQRESRRVFHGRGKIHPGFEHICIDWYSPTLLITVYEPECHLDSILSAVEDSDIHSQVTSILLQMRYKTGSPAKTLKGKVPNRVLIFEDGLSFEVHLGTQQNSGFFLDMRPLRGWIKANSSHKNVLNLFAYTCSFSVAALAGGAKSVTNVDMSKTSLRWGLLNHSHNHQDCRSVNQIPHNIFTSWGRIKQLGRYDLLIIDPPTRQHRSFNAEKNYAAIIKRIPQVCNDGADIIATLNSPFLDKKFLLGKFARHAPTAEFIASIPASPEFRDKHPEKALKILRFKHRF